MDARNGAVSHRADIFALGLILNEMFTATVPLAPGYPHIGNVSPSHAYLNDIVSGMILHSPADRYAAITKIKEQLISRGQAFVALQKLDEVTRKVVPATTSDDPLNGQEIQVTSLDFEPGNPGELTCGFNLNPPSAWKAALQNLQNFHYTTHAHPARVRFFAHGAAVPTTEQSCPNTAKYFKQWVAAANENYRDGCRARRTRNIALVYTNSKRSVREPNRKRAQPRHLRICFEFSFLA